MNYVIFIIPLLITIIGFFMYKYPPKKPNWFVGYRTRSSMKDKNIWERANKYCGQLFIKVGLITLLISLLIWILGYFKIIIFSEMLLAIIVLCEVGTLLLSGIMVENKIKSTNKKF